MKVNGKTVYFSGQFLVPQNQLTSIEVDIADPVPLQLNLDLLFVSDVEQQSSVHWEFSPPKSKFLFTFKNWNNPLGQAVLAPAKIGDIGGRPLYFQAAAHAIADTYLVYFTLLGD